MKILKAKAEILFLDDQRAIDEIYARIETAGRTCYKSENHITPESSRKFAAMVVKNHHEAMLEHASVMVRFTVDRGVSHEIVRHRLASFAQESTRYCNYSKNKFGKELTFIKPCFINEDVITSALNKIMIIDSDTAVLSADERIALSWHNTCKEAEKTYMYMISDDATPQEARSVLPNSLKTEVVMTANIREWRLFFRLRAACETGMPHPQMLEVAVPLYQEMQIRLPELFNDIVIPDDVMKQYGKTFFVPSVSYDDQIEGQISIEELLNEQQSN